MNDTLVEKFTSYLIALATFSKPWAIGLHIVFWAILVTVIIASLDKGSGKDENEGFKSTAGLLLLFVPIFILIGFILVQYTPLGKI